MLDIAKDTITTLIVEDNPDACSHLKTLLKEFEEIKLLGEAGNGKKAIQFINRSRPDLIFLDIQLPDITGFDVLTALQHTPAVVFTTAFDQYALKAFDVNGIDYLLKPVQLERLRVTIERVVQLKLRPKSQLMEIVDQILKERNKRVRFSVHQGDQILIIPQEELIYFKSDDRYLFLCTWDKNYFYNSSLKDLEKSLAPDYFCRINKSSIVSIDKIERLKKDYLSGYKVIMKDKDKTSLKVSRSCLPKLKKKLDNF